MVVRALSEVADATLFGILAVLDGTHTIEKQGEKSAFHLSVLKEGVESVICPGRYDLHDLIIYLVFVLVL